MYAIYFRLQPTEFFKVSQDGLTCKKLFASTGEANVALGRQQYACDPCYSETEHILFGHCVLESRLYSKFRIEVKLKASYGGCIGICVMDESYCLISSAFGLDYK